MPILAFIQALNAGCFTELMALIGRALTDNVLELNEVDHGSPVVRQTGVTSNITTRLSRRRHRSP